MDIKPIETWYNGYRFRSRLEARWAVFFGRLGVNFEYEPEGFDLGSAGWYLPDFYLPSLNCYVEVKPDLPLQSGVVNKLDAFPFPLWLVFGEPAGNLYPFKPQNAWVMFRPDYGCDSPYLLCVCPMCREIGIEFEGRAGRLTCACYPGDDKVYNYNAPLIFAAAMAARAARFDDGGIYHG